MSSLFPPNLIDMAKKRIREHEAFLAECGITPLGGAELEGHYNLLPETIASLEASKQKHAPAPRANRGEPLVGSPDHPLGTTNVFGESPIIESIKSDAFIPDITWKGTGSIAEAVIGNGPKGRLWKYPAERHPSTVVRATESVKRIIADRANEHGIDVTFGQNKNGERIRSLQSNVSLWRTSDKTPLFLRHDGSFVDMPDSFTWACAEHVVKAQMAMAALVSPTNASFRRYTKKDMEFNVDRDKVGEVTLLVRRNKGIYSPYLSPEERKEAEANPQAGTEGRRTAEGKSLMPIPKSYYLEDHLASSEAEPAFAMLITLGGMVQGVKKAMTNLSLVDAHGQPDPAQMKNYLESYKPRFRYLPEFSKGTVPRNHRDALANLEGSSLAKEIMGEEFHAAFCKAYEGLIPVAQEFRGR